LRQSYKTVLLWVVLILMFVAFYQFFAQHGREQKEFAFSDFVTKVEAGDVRDVNIKDTNYYGHLRDGSDFHTVGPLDATASVFDRLQKKGVKVLYEKADQNSFWVQVSSTSRWSSSSSSSSSSCASSRLAAGRP
jgi:cell division protease FtsH